MPFPFGGHMIANLLAFNSIRKIFLIPTMCLCILLIGGLGTLLSINNSSAIHSMMDSKGNAMARFMAKISSGKIS